MNERKIADVGFGLIVLAYCIYAGIFILESSCVVGGERYFSLFDDAMVSMRYARNLAEGHGLVWNPGGERVEGYTNFLWVLFMALVHALPIAAAKVPLGVQAGGAALLVANLFYVRKLARLASNGSTAAQWIATALTAFYLPLNTWGLLGMEVSALALIVTVSAWMALSRLASGAFSAGPYVALALGALCRIDMAVPFLATLAFLAAFDGHHRRKHIVWGLALFVLSAGAQTLFRLWYFGDPLPNTYYLKMTGCPATTRILRGAHEYVVFASHMNWFLLLAPVLLLLRRPEKRLFFLAWIFAAQSAYSMWVGGDAWEFHGGSNRFVCIVMPLFFALFATTLVEIFFFASRWPRLVVGGRSWDAAAAVGATLCAVNFNAIRGPEALGEWLLLQRPFQAEENAGQVQTAQFILRATEDQATVAVVWAGAIPYWSNRRCVDLLGKTDRFIARLPMHDSTANFSYKDYYPGHMKWDYRHSIGDLKPDLVVGLWRDPEEALPYLADYEAIRWQDGALFARKGSPNVKWAEIGKRRVPDDNRDAPPAEP